MSEVTISELVQTGVLRRPKDGVRLVGNEAVIRAVKLTLDHASVGAKAAVEEAGGSIAIIEPKVLPADVAKRAKTAAKKANKANKAK